MKTRKKTGHAKHKSKCRAVGKRCDKESRDRVRLGKPACIGDDKCGAMHAGFKCYRESGHGGMHKGYRIGQVVVKRWKQTKDGGA